MNNYLLAGHKVEVFDSIDELPIKRFHKYNKFMLIDSGIGGNLEDVNSHLNRIAGFIANNPENAYRELENLRQNIYLITQELSPKHLAFCTLVKSIDGKEVTDLTETGLKKILDKLNNTKVNIFDSLISSLKKKLMTT